MNSQKTLVVCDIDGTILNNNHKLTQTTIDGLTKLRSQYSNLILCLVTGRNWEETQEIYQQLNLDTVAVCCNSCQIVKPNDPTFSPRYFTFDKSFLQSIFNDQVFVDQMEWTVVTTVEKTYNLHSSQEINDFLINYYNSCHHEVAYIRTKFKNRSLVNYLFSHIKNIATTLLIQCWEYENSDVFFMEIGVPYATKKLGVEFLSSYYNVDYQNIYIFGDNINDLTMLKMPCNTYALSNGVTQAKIYAKKITDKSNSEDGVIHELFKVFPVK
ncbi:Cof subfamily protein (haloacid dehalogenase superfamily) [Mycoplasmoides fastidiosum]|uniref:Cof subfamily protein (Haloacid dehalogenase superfamily) n=1 Tax=Mycoplasmoides fastidiosum TaxID=92758 RepID=A0ABU0LZ04_9BACT|nr:HAD family hydrolase [Mycoplasmoides fastidiosum]MDQ0513825.1 Cof subfamily protein (haloacid dehalogenase superfamily) [Mycoplasmoides fastidiosum]UUD37758.1 Cof-type HAD-IIB family hydrolase [Mycoplasmoides fastidiosum]